MGPAVLLGVALLTIGLALPWQFQAPSITHDEAHQLVHPERVRAGSIPHRDFEHIYGPTNLWILSGLFELIGPSVEVERAVGLGYRVALDAALFAIARR